MEINLKRGKLILVMIICSILLLDATTTALVTIKFGLHRLSHGIMRFIVTAIFMYFIYKGKRWAKNLFVGLLIYAIIVTLIRYDMTLLLNPLMLLFLAVCSVSAFSLIFSKEIRFFLEEKSYERQS
ncbi:MAG: hypothetical protein N4A62_19615 [Marinisporobacter sp.]|nr:hypothetical protein [Marinisporobacter sp.]